MTKKLVLGDKQIQGLITQDMLATFWNQHAQQYGIKNTRHRNNIIHKHAFFVIARLSTTLSLASIGGILGKDHATVLHACRNHESNYNYDPSYRVVYDDMFVRMEDYLLENGIVPNTVNDDMKKDGEVRDIHFKFLSVSRRLRDKTKELNSLKKSIEVRLKRADVIQKHFTGMQTRIYQLESELKRVKNLL